MGSTSRSGRLHTRSALIAVVLSIGALLPSGVSAQASATTPSTPPAAPRTPSAVLQAVPAASFSAPTLTVKKTKPGTVTPDSASGCSLAVCIYVDGNGLYINYVESYAVVTKDTCAIAAFKVNGNPGAFSNPVCANAGDELVGVWWTYQNFPNQTQLCASMVETISSWSDLIPVMPGEPCETVHS